MDTVLKRCCSCGDVQPLDEFNKRKAAPDGLQARCRSCCRLWYVANAAAHKANVRRRNDEQRRLLHEQLAVFLRVHPCVDCGETDIRCLEFDHRERATKSAEISRLITGAVSWEVLLREIEKCDVRCANCHRRRTADQFSTWRHRLHEEETADLRAVALHRLRTLLPATRGMPMADEWSTVRTPDGRDLELLLMGDPDGFPLVYIPGTPTAIAPYPDLSAAAAERGLRVVGWSRPGYAGSTRREGRTVADAAEDVATILDTLGHDRFVVLGWSGGGPHAIACAAMLPARCGAAASLAGVAPYDLMGEDWFRDMGKENVDEFRIAIERPQDLWAVIEPQAPEIAAITGGEVVSMLSGLIDDVDRAALTGEFAEVMAENFRRAVSKGVAGWHDDDLAFAQPWGFDLADITVPVSVWQGEHDLMVPFPHGQFLAAHIPTADAHLYPDEGHLSLAAQLPRILTDLTERAGL